MPVFDFSAASADNNEKKSQCTYTTFHSNETTATPEKPVLILDNSKREWKHHSCGPKLQDTFIPGHGGDLAGGHQLPAKPLHILAVTFRLSTASALGLHRDGGLAQPVFRNIL